MLIRHCPLVGRKMYENACQKTLNKNFLQQKKKDLHTNAISLNTNNPNFNIEVIRKLCCLYASKK
jgi:hypothetical protein